MTSIRKAKKAFKRKPYYKRRKVKTFIWHKVTFKNKETHLFTRWRFLHKKLVFKNQLFQVKVFYVGFDDLKRYYENIKNLNQQNDGKHSKSKKSF